jgi:hypothetical protein
MKQNLFTYILVFASTMLLLSSCGDDSKPGQTKDEFGNVIPEESPNIKVVFVPKTQIEESKAKGRFQPNTFYWSNMANEVDNGVKTVNSPQGPALQMKGIGDSNTEKHITVVTLYRAFNVPPKAKNAEVQFVINRKYDDWSDNKPHKRYIGIGSSFIKDGKEAGVASYDVGFRSETLKEIKKTIYVPEGAQQMVFKFTTDFPNTIELLDMNVTFD